MTGSFRHVAGNGLPDDPYRRAVVSLDDGSDVVYRDVRRFGTWLLAEPEEVEPYLAARLGREPLAEVHARDDSAAETAAAEIATAYRLHADAPAARTILIDVVTG